MKLSWRCLNINKLKCFRVYKRTISEKQKVPDSTKIVNLIINLYLLVLKRAYYYIITYDWILFVFCSLAMREYTI